MSVWTGWQADLLAAASLPDTTENRRFLTEWHQYVAHDCAFNPVEISHKETGSTDCGTVLIGTLYAQAYTGKARAGSAFNAQLFSRTYKHLAEALMTGDPYTVSYFTAVANNLSDWGSGAFSGVYFAEGQAGIGGGPGKPPPGSAQTLGGWKDVQRSFNHHMPRALKASQRSRKAALRSLARASKVKL